MVSINISVLYEGWFDKEIFINLQVQLKYGWTFAKGDGNKWLFGFEYSNYSALQRDTVI